MRASKNEKRPDPFEEEQPSGYHYSRQERLSLPTAPRFPGRGGGIFRRDRILLIILLDLIIVLILGVFLIRFLYGQVNRANLEGYSVVLRGVCAGEVVLASLTVTNARATDQAQRRITVRFSLVRDPGEEDSNYVSALAPLRRKDEMNLRAVLPATESAKVLYAQVQIGDALRRLSVGLEP
ncbi:MAG: hypothetical protein JSV89_21330 [Spirochaetaceae bacterium]|nr:MAG: hypothetical protein JSV89_21330 [Spirochaetaceae bacterium]